jgi:hypothetical protein
MMRIAFVTGSLAPGRDGVGDHVRLLAAECARRGHAVMLVSLAEAEAPEPMEEAAWPIRRFTAAECFLDEGRAVRGCFDEFVPEWVSLHFVPYSFHARGFFGRAIPLLGNVLAAAPRRHVFFHETWIGQGKGASWRKRMTGWWQRRTTQTMMRHVRSNLVHTSIGYYRAALSSIGQPTILLPMFGNVPPINPTPAGEIPGIGREALVCGIFGTLHQDWNPGKFLQDFAALATAQRRPAILAAVGESRSSVDFFHQIAAEWRGRIGCVILGRQTPEQLAKTFARFDFGVSPMSWLMIGKSGSAAALREHGLRVVVTHEGDWPRFPVTRRELEPDDEGFVPYFRAGVHLAEALEKTPPRPGVSAMCGRFLADLEAVS